jgi:hypothetical protein
MDRRLSPDRSCGGPARPHRFDGGRNSPRTGLFFASASSIAAQYDGADPAFLRRNKDFLRRNKEFGTSGGYYGDELVTF